MDKPIVVGHSMGGTVAALFMGGIKNNPWPLFPLITCPVLVLEGEKSEDLIFTELEKASALIPRGSYALVQGAGHPIPMERPKELVPSSVNFSRRLCSNGCSNEGFFEGYLQAGVGSCCRGQ